MKINFKNKSEILSLSNLLLSIIIAIINIVIYACVGEIKLFLTMFIINILILLFNLIGYKTKLPILYIGSSIVMIILNSLTNYDTFVFNYTYLIGAILLIIGSVIEIIFLIIEKQKPQFKGIIYIASFSIILCSFFSYYFIECNIDKNKTNVELNKWAVPSFIDNKECENKGEVLQISYKTKAYATDNREVIKSANVYLPYNYSKHEQYNILYLMHGTGDNENYWLIKHHSNKIMLDNLIDKKIISPLIVVTPTFYVENDCENELDKLTYSFNEELRNDLMPYIESNYSTYAKSTSKDDFILSRDHRAFAGLSRGGVTMYHSALCKSLDYFSYFGAFSGSRTSGEELKNNIQSEELKNYSINYLYVTGGTLDFILPDLINDYNEQIKEEPRLKLNENTSFDITFLKRHSIENWHLNLYNFLQLIFK